eukprot:TRINITY_DN4208_c0_g1_i3.p1 TRINITY_DN4208_c0_g1~~TRINITY_DN4208_c0_g1_i3.p1  ORF type:complete len:170 (-),score=50.62 TRINITY_DN4208_c0_g1_i3:142-651(-)
MCIRDRFWEQDDDPEQQVSRSRKASGHAATKKKDGGGGKSAEKKEKTTGEEESPNRKSEMNQINAPSFYRSIRIGDLKASFSYKSKSRLKRLKDIRLAIDPFVSYSTLGNNKIVFDEFVKHVKKRALKLVFSIVGQKIGISSGDIVIGEEIDAKDTEKKRKLLFGDQTS